MPLEACMIILDNSEYMRNGDYAPTRFAAQNDAVSLIFNAKTGSNPENTVGVMSMAGSSPQVLATLTQDFGKVLSSMKKCHVGGSADLITSLNVAQLALKHRENKNQRQRIVAFIASPVDAVAGSSLEDQLVKLGKKMKKNNVAIDVVLFGEEGMENEVVMGKFVEACQSGDNCHIVSIPPGPHLLSDMIASSPILAADGGAFAASAAAGAQGDGDIDMAALGGEGGGDDFGGIDPNMDPELAMAIRMSLQEEEERQRRAAGTSEPAPATEQPTAAESTTASNVPAGAVPIEAPSASEAAQPAVPPPHSVPGSTTHAQPESTESAPISTSGVLHGPGDVEMEGDEDEDDADLLAAIAMSMESGGGDEQKGDQEEEKKS
ncbi:proteasome regulatory particle base subunit rpn10 [Naganishia albida]|nr:proteasome regulatory particle base subunit rpn10 [Naganishia albida]